MSPSLLVTGATGKQGGATIRALLHSDFEILALTRDATSAPAQKLAALSPNVKLLQGNLNNVAAIFDQARIISRNSIWGIFSVSPINKRDPSVEEVQGRNLIDAAVFNNVQLFVYTSVDRGGAQSATTPTNVPFWTTKHRIEQHLRIKAKSSGMRYTILRPTSFMELVSDDLTGRMFATMWKNHFDNQRMHLVAVRDIGYFAAQAFLHSDRYMGVEMTLTGDELTFAEADAVFRDKFGKPLPTANSVLVSVFLRVSKTARIIFESIKERPADLGIEECRKIHPGLTDWKTWIGEESNFAKKLDPAM
ncbi:nucleoside-diphosphate-sugar epimerase family protein [Ampelomyces quisqualis]|uniref:Nucleoside-diphosphate-sugar epimerase family protein n=1 Tax=Ampelomyces quisqualis TaxID=50730 RepID=A0A6A5QCW4_AMPQU|nr:nucleoside-diphosphate-sugar epimerase family protein [Ampelomyces quisqualis]